ncbi:hypothetical protein Ancab_005339, partial [Ancistrocladus abbreviatus]
MAPLCLGERLEGVLMNSISLGVAKVKIADFRLFVSAALDQIRQQRDQLCLGMENPWKLLGLCYEELRS